MKRLIYFAAALIVIAIGSASCEQTGKVDNVDSLAVDSLDSINANDSVEFTIRRFTFTDHRYNESKDTTASYSVIIDLPQGPRSLVRSISQWLNEVLEVETEANMFDSSHDAMRQLAKAFYDKNTERGPKLTFNASITKVFEDSVYVTYEYKGSVYNGGENDMPYFYGMTFDKATGKAISNDLFTKTEGLTDLISKHLMAYFGDTTIKDLSDVMYETAVAELPMPEHAAWMVDSGMVFCYGAYEIAPYTAGMPKCTIPLSELKPFMVKEEKKSEEQTKEAEKTKK